MLMVWIVNLEIGVFVFFVFDLLVYFDIFVVIVCVLIFKKCKWFYIDDVYDVYEVDIGL